MTGDHGAMICTTHKPEMRMVCSAAEMKNVTELTQLIP